MEEEDLLLLPGESQTEELEKDQDELAKQQLEIKKMQEEVKQVVPEIDSRKGIDIMTPESYSSLMVESLTVPAKAAALETPDKFWDKYKDRYIAQNNGDEIKAKEEADKVYQLVVQQYQRQAFREVDATILENMEYMMQGIPNVSVIGEGYSPNVGIVPQTISGSNILFDQWTDPVRDEREVMLDSKEVVTDDGEVIKFEEDPYELAYNPKYANKEGKNIIAFVYEHVDPLSRDYGTARIRAIYEGEEIPEGYEIVSKMDAYDTFLRSNTLKTSVWKATAGSITDFVIDAVDTVFAIIHHGANLLSVGTYSEYGLDEWDKDVRMYLKTWMTSTSKYDQEHMMSLNNMIGLGINIAGIILTGRAIATAGAKLAGIGLRASEEIGKLTAVRGVLEQQLANAVSKIEKKLIGEQLEAVVAKLTQLTDAYASNASKVKKVTSFTLGALMAKHTADEAEAIGFTPFESSLVFLGGLTTMGWVSKISELGYERLGLNYIDDLIKDVAHRSLLGVEATETSEGLINIFSKYKAIGNNVAKSLSSAVNKLGPMGSNVTRQAFEGQMFTVADQLVRQTANAYANIGYKDVKTRPHFHSASDPGYWKEVMNESVMNIIGGIFGGVITGAHSMIAGHHLPNKVNEKQLLQKGQTAENLKIIGWAASRTAEGMRWYNDLNKEWDKMMDKGLWGREDISNLWLEKENRFKLTEELTEEDRKKGYMSQAQFHYLASKAQLEYYRLKYQNTDQTIEEIVADDEDFGFLLKSKTLYEESRNLFDKKAELYSKANIPDGLKIDEQLADLSREKDKIKITKEGVVDNKEKYQEKLEKFSSISGLSTSEIETLIEVNKAIKDIGTGKAVQIMYLKHLFSSGKYKKLSYSFFRKLLESDSKRQLVFKEMNKKALEYQESLGNDILAAIRKNGGVIPIELARELLEIESSHLLLSKEAKQEIIEAIDKLGKSFAQKKIELADVVLNKTADIFKEAAADEVVTDEAYFGSEPISYSDVFLKLKKLVKEHPDDLRDAIIKYKEDDALYKFLKLSIDDFNKVNAIADLIKSGDIDKRNLKFFEAVYTINKLMKISNAKDLTALEFIKFNTDSVYSDATKSLADEISMLLLEQQAGSVKQLLYNDVLVRNDISKAEPVTDIILTEKEKTEGKTFDEKVDPESTLKTHLIKKLKDVATVYPDNVNNDLLHGFIKEDNGNIKPSDRSLYDMLQDLMNSSAATKDKDGKLIYFSELEVAENFLDQVETRLEENIFLLESIGMLNKLEILHKTKLNNSGTPETFLTDYLKKYFVDVGKLEEGDIYARTVSELKSNINTLEVIRKGALNLIEKAKDATVKQRDIYIKNAVDNLSKSISHIMTIFGDGEALKQVTPEFTAVVDEVLKIANKLDLNDRSADNLGALAEADYTIKSILHNTYVKVKEQGETALNTFIEDNIKPLYNVSNKAIFHRFVKALVEPVEIIHAELKDYHKAIDELIKGNPDEIDNAKLLTTAQINWIEDMVTVGTDANFLKILKKVYGNEDFNEYIAIYSGDMGAGKTRVIGGHVVKLVYDILNKNVTDPDKLLHPLFAGAKRQQSKILRLASSKTTIKPGNIKGTGDIDVDQYDLYKFFKDKDIDTLHNDLKNIGVILIDEISQLEYLGKKSSSEEDMGVLDLILDKLQKVNEKRIEDGLPELSVIGIGDERQPGYISGEKSPRNEKGIVRTADEKAEKANVFSVLSADKIYKSDVILDINFRTKILDAAENIYKLNEVLQLGYINGKKVNYPTFKYEIKNGSHRGFRIKKETFTERLNDSVLARDIEDRIKATMKEPEDKKFKVMIVDGAHKFDPSILDGTAIGELYNKYKDHFIVESYEGIHGDEANYVIMNADSEFFLNVTEEQLLNGKIGDNIWLFRNRVDKFTMAMGRAYEYVDVAFNAEFNLLSVNEPVNMSIPKVDRMFKEQWLSVLLNDILMDGEKIEISTQTQEGKEGQTGKKGQQQQKKQKKNKKQQSGGSINRKLITVGKLILPGDNPASDTKTTSSKAVEVDVVSTDVDYLIKQIPVPVNLTSKSNIKLIIEDLNKILPKQDAITKAKLNIIIERLEAIDTSITDNIPDPEFEALFNKDFNESKEKIEAENDKDYMIKAEKEGQMVMYGHLAAYESIKGHQRSYETIMRNLYGEKKFNPVSDAIYYDGNVAKVNSDKYDFYLVSYADPKLDGSHFMHHVLVAKSNGESHIIAQLPELSNYEKHGRLWEYFNGRQKFIKNNIDSPDNVLKTNTITIYSKDGKPFEHTVYFFESKVTLPSALIKGMTVGNVLEYSKDIKDAMSTLGLSKKISNWENVEIGRPTIKSVSNSKVLSAIKGIKKLGADNKTFLWDKSLLQKIAPADLPFKNFSKNKYVIDLDGDKYIAVNTTKGDVMFKLVNNKWTPVIGSMGIEPIIGTEIITDSKNFYFDLEMSLISKQLQGIERVVDETNIMETGSVGLMNELRRLKLPSYDKSLSEDIIKTSMLREFKDRATTFLGNISLDFNDAKTLWDNVGGARSYSTAKLIMRGEHKGKGVVFYTFRPDINLGSMTNKEFNDFYLKVLQHKTENKSLFTDNASGIGMVLLDAKPRFLTDIAKILGNNYDITSADFNKVVLSKDSEKLMLNIFSALRVNAEDAGSITNKSKIARQLYEGVPDDLRNIIKEWYDNELKGDTKLAINSILNDMFEPGNTGRVVVELDVNDDVRHFFEQVEEILNTHKSEDEKLEMINQAKSKVKTSLAELGEITNIADLKNFVLNHDSDANAGGFALLNKNGKFILKKTPTTVVTAVDVEWATNSYGDPNAIPDPHFDLYRLLNLVNRTTGNNATAESQKIFRGALRSIDDLLKATGRVPKGLYASPLVADFNAYIGDISSESLFNEFTTTVKQIRQPAVSMYVDALLDNVVVQSVNDVVTSNAKANIDKIVNEYITRAKTTPISKFTDLLNEIKSDTTLSDVNKNNLSEQLLEMYHTSKRRITAKAVDHFKSKGLEYFTLSLSESNKNNLKTITDVALVLSTSKEGSNGKLFIELSNIVDSLIDSNSQKNRINEVLKLVFDDANKLSNIEIEKILSSNEVASRIKEVIKNSGLSEDALISELAESNRDINSLKQRVKDYPIEADMNPIMKLIKSIDESKSIRRNKAAEVEAWITEAMDLNSKAAKNPVILDKFIADPLLHSKEEVARFLQEYITNPNFIDGLISLYNSIDLIYYNSRVKEALNAKTIQLLSEFVDRNTLDAEILTKVNELRKLAGQEAIDFGNTSGDIQIKNVEDVLTFYERANRDIDADFQLSEESLSTLKNVIKDAIEKHGLTMEEITIYSNEELLNKNPDVEDVVLEKIHNSVENLKLSLDEELSIVTAIEEMRSLEDIKCFM